MTWPAGRAVAQQQLAAPEHRARVDSSDERDQPAPRAARGQRVAVRLERLAAEERLVALERGGEDQPGLDRACSRATARAGRRGSPSPAAATRSRSSRRRPRRRPTARRRPSTASADRHGQLPAELADVRHPGRPHADARRPSRRGWWRTGSLLGPVVARQRQQRREPAPSRPSTA